MNKHYRIVSIKRFITFLIMCAILIIGATASAVLGFYDAEGTTKESCVEVEVEAGDTLWDIAHQYSDNKTDVRDMVYAICRINNIGAGDIREGDILLIPEKL